MWNNYAEKLSKTKNVICVDLLGQGETECLGYVHSMHEHAKAVKCVLNAEAIENCIVVGHSMGGYVALELADLHPEMIKGLVLFHSTAFADTDERKAERERVTQLVQRNKTVYIKAVIPSLFADETKGQLTTEIEQLAEIADGFSEHGITANIRGMMERPARVNVLQNGGFPKLIIQGEFDAVISADDIKEQSALNENISLKVVTGIGHMGHLEAPENCLELISDFCKN